MWEFIVHDLSISHDSPADQDDAAFSTFVPLLGKVLLSGIVRARRVILVNLVVNTNSAGLWCVFQPCTRRVIL